MSHEAGRAGAVCARSYHLGVDLGQRVDHTAIVVVEQRVVTTGRRDPASYEWERQRKCVVRLVERIRLGQGFQTVAQEVERLTNAPELADGNVTTAVDATGMGLPVTETLRGLPMRGELYPVVITGGLEGRYQHGYFPTPKVELLMALERGLEMGELCVAEQVAGWPAMAEELGAMRKLPGRNGPRYESMGAHDDLVMALALAMFGVRMRPLAVEGWRLRVGLE